MQNDTCYILALFKRDDGERLLLGSGFYEFDKGQKHFNPNTFANDIVELQGADGQLLAGQVRRSTSQSFDGVIGDGTTSKATVEQKRREFFLFFRKQHHYTVVYIFPDGTAIKRDRGYITDAPAVQELYQVQPKWHIALAFEDVNYYSYAEDAQGNEIYSFEAELGLANIADGGLVWDANGAISDASNLNLVDIKGNTFQQTFEGKNLLPPIPPTNPSDARGITTTVDAETGKITISGTSTANYPWIISATVNIPAGTYTISIDTTLPKQMAFRFYYDSTHYAEGSISAGQMKKSVTLANATVHIAALYNLGRAGVVVPSTTFGVQLESGSDATGFEKYVGGQASPSPAYPQQIQTVTGSQTITIHGTDYPLDLGTIELCEITYSTSSWQDYIYKDGDDWKIHKATASKTFSGAESENWVISNTGTPNFWYRARNAATGTYGTPDNARYLFCNYESGTQITSSNTTQGVFIISSGDVRLRYGTEMSLDDWKAKLSTTNMVLTYALATPTDTTITDTTLIAQLEAIEEAMAEYGKPSAIVPTGQNLAVIITGDPAGTGGYIFAPSTGGGPIIVTVNGVDDANPVWHVYGPATNPTLTNSTTGEALTWNGTIPANQELIIDMGQQTATLEGANVFEFVSGSWVQLAPGQNRISYTAANTTRSSKVFWNEVVG